MAVDAAARNRWLSWWLRMQHFPEQTGSALDARLREFEDMHGGHYAELYAGVYEKYGKGYRMGAGRFQSAVAGIEKMIGLLAGRPAHSLDCGCGLGEIVRHMKSLGIAGHGIDVTPTPGWDDARRFHRGDLRRTHFGDRQFDMLTCFDVLEHIEERHVPLVLREMRRIGRALYAEVRRGPARIKAPGEFVDENLHACQQTGEWWFAQFRSAGWNVLEQAESGSTVKVWAQ